MNMSRETKTTKKLNIWKWTTILLLAMIIIPTIIIFIQITDSSGSKPLKEPLPQNTPKVTMYFSPDDLNKVIAGYLSANTKDSSQYRVTAEGDSISFKTNFEFLNQNVDLKLTFKPELDSAGNVILHQESMTLGKVKLPVKLVMSAVKKNFDFPNWVHVQSNKKQVYLALDEIESKTFPRLAIDSFALDEERITITLLLPTK
ncbi:DUF2140 family protein [Brochothrix thermosphacta]|uniref:DUF2140 domain-containing protein n=2 Tax=Listeriaceae TaxID=186820 RepID=A0A291KI10_BROTH|nr:DUF2140 domain-containing protein [Brochothrix thermosphacta]ATH86180.1 DUF2140 domain-containing protein [Brochothrix thermosphacta]MPQ29270.1 DUF2140 family protein [Brochothrix thermosphacta]